MTFVRPSPEECVRQAAMLEAETLALRKKSVLNWKEVMDSEFPPLDWEEPIE